MSYPLAALLAVSRRRERQRAGEAAEAIRAAAEACRRLERANAEARAAAEAARGAGTPPSGAEAWAGQVAARSAGRRRAEQAEAEQRLAEASGGFSATQAALALRREALAAAIRARRALERHRDGWRTERRRARDGAEEGEAEDARAGRR